MRRPRRALRHTLAFAALLALPQVANGAQFCVGDTGTTCDGGSYPFDAAGLAAAAMDAEVRAGADELRISAGTITGAAPIASTGGQGLSISGAPGAATTVQFAAGTGTAISITGAGDVRDLGIEGSGSAGLTYGAPAGSHDVDRVRVKGFATGISASAAAAGGMTIRDTLVDLASRDGARGIVASASALGSSPTKVTARRVTVGGTGPNQLGVQASGTFGGNGTVVLEGSVLYLTGSAAASVRCTTGLAMFPGTSDVTQTTTAYRPSANPAASGCAGITASVPVDLSLVSPWFVNASAGDYRPLSFSPFIDAGGVTAAAFDAGGGERPVDGNGDGLSRLDLGAFEYQRRAPDPPVIDMPVTTVAPGEALAFKATATDPDGEFPFVTWSYGDGTEQNGSAVHAYAALGTYTATATAKDPVGLTSTSQVQITVVNPPGPPIAAPVAPTPAPPDPFFSATGPRVRVLASPTASIKRSKRGFSTPSLATNRTATLESAGAVTLRVGLTRLVPGRKASSKAKCRTSLKKGKRCTVRKRVSAVGQIPVSPGQVILGFGGKLGKRRLAKGTYEVTVTPIGIDKTRGTPAKYAIRLR